MTIPTTPLSDGVIATGAEDPSAIARIALHGGTLNATVVKGFALSGVSSINAADLVQVLDEHAKAISGGDFSQVEAKLFAQASALDSIFVEMSQRCAQPRCEH